MRSTNGREPFVHDGREVGRDVGQLFDSSRGDLAHDRVLAAIAGRLLERDEERIERACRLTMRVRLETHQQVQCGIVGSQTKRVLDRRLRARRITVCTQELALGQRALCLRIVRMIGRVLADRLDGDLIGGRVAAAGAAQRENQEHQENAHHSTPSTMRRWRRIWSTCSTHLRKAGYSSGEIRSRVSSNSVRVCT